MFQVPATPLSPYIISPFCLDIRALGMQKSFWTEKKGGKWGISLSYSSMNSLFSLLSSVSRKLRDLDVAGWRDLKRQSKNCANRVIQFLEGSVFCFILFFFSPKKVCLFVFYFLCFSVATKHASFSLKIVSDLYQNHKRHKVNLQFLTKFELRKKCELQQCFN